MRWKSRYYLKDRLGEKRVVQKFVLFPRMFEGFWYWLMWLDIEEEICEVAVGGSMEWGCFAYKWVETGLSEEGKK